MWDNWRNSWRNWKNVHERIDKMQKLGGMRIWILHVLDHGPKNGVEIMDAIQEHQEIVQQMYKKRMRQFADDKYSQHYDHHFQRKMNCVPSRPSPGSVYPMLKKMVDEELIKKIEDGKYDLTEDGRQCVYEIFGGLRGPDGEQMDRGTFAVKSALDEIEGYISYLENIRKEKLRPYDDVLDDLSHRLKKLKESLHED